MQKSEVGKESRMSMAKEEMANSSRPRNTIECNHDSYREKIYE
jgi:hypothetical protein